MHKYGDPRANPRKRQVHSKKFENRWISANPGICNPSAVSSSMRAGDLQDGQNTISMWQIYWRNQQPHTYTQIFTSFTDTSFKWLEIKGEL